MFEEPQPSPQKAIESAILVFENEAKAKPNIELKPSLSSTSLVREKCISRQQFMLQKKTELETQLTHYTKVKNRWARADATVTIVGTYVVLISSILSSISSVGIAAPIVAATLSGIATAQAGLIV